MNGNRPNATLTAANRRMGGDPAVVLGVGDGTLTALAGFVGYVVLPALTTDADMGFVAAATEAAITCYGLSPAHHAGVLLLPPFVVAFVGLTLLRRWGATGRREDLKFLTGVVVVPLAAVVATYLLASVGVGLTFGSGRIALSSVSDVAGAVAFTVWALVFGLVFLFVAGPLVFVGQTAGALVGYACAVGLERFRSGGTDRPESPR